MVGTESKERQRKSALSWIGLVTLIGCGYSYYILAPQRWDPEDGFSMGLFLGGALHPVVNVLLSFLPSSHADHQLGFLGALSSVAFFVLWAMYDRRGRRGLLGVALAALAVSHAIAPHFLYHVLYGPAWY